MGNNDSSHSTKYFESLDSGKVKCTLCPRNCTISEGNRGVCFVRKNEAGTVVLTTYGKSSGFAIDPIEKKPLYHFHPGSSIFSFGTAGCNLTCKFCQNWDISRAKDFDRLTQKASPDDIANTIKSSNTKSVAFTYNEPIIFMEYAIDTAIACHELGISTVAVTAGYINKEPREEFFKHMDAANVDLKGFTDNFYKKLCGAHLEPVLETLKYIKKKTKTWLEVTTLLIPGENDSEKELNEMCEWAVDNLGKDVPWHFSAFHPAFNYIDSYRTPPETLFRARKIAMSKGMKYVYTGNVYDPEGGSTYCHKCNTMIIEREFYDIKNYKIKDGKCTKCGTKVSGVFSEKSGKWGTKRKPFFF